MSCRGWRGVAVGLILLGLTGVVRAASLSGTVRTDTGVPLANAQVYLYGYSSGYYNYYSTTAYTNASGAYNITSVTSYSVYPYATIALPDGTYTFTISSTPADGPGYVPYSQWSYPVSGSVTQDATLEAAGAMSGRVTDEAGNPVVGQYGGGASISAYSYAYGGSAYGYGYSDSSGSFTMKGLKAGTYDVSVYPPYGSDFAQARKTAVAVTKGVTTSGVNFALPRAGRIAGRVTGDGGAPLSGVSLSANGWAYGNNAYGWGYTDSQGNYVMTGLTPGTYDLSTSAWGTDYIQAQKTGVGVVSGSTATVNFSLAKGGSVAGQITDESGAPVPSAWVSLSGPGWGWGNSGADGRYKAGGLASGTYSVYVGATGFVAQWRSGISVTQGLSTGGVDFRLTRGGTLRVTVTAGGSPVSGAWVNANGPGWGYGTTGSNGVATMSGLSPGTYYVYVTATGYASARKNLISVQNNQTTDVPVALTAGEQISGRITNASGAPVSGVQVYAYGQSLGYYGWGNSYTTDGNGQYVIKNLPAGKYTVSVYSADYVRTSRWGVQAPSSGVDFVLSRGGQIVGKVMAPDGGGIGGMSVYAYADPWRDGGWAWGSTMGDGSYTLTRVPAGSYVVRTSLGYGATDKGYVPVSMRGVVVADDQNTTANLTLKAGVTISGKVTDEAGQAISGVSLWGNANDSDSWWLYSMTTSAGDGAYTLKGISPDVDGYDITAYKWSWGGQGDGKKYGRRVKYAVSPKSASVDFVLPIADGSVSGKVVDGKGNPLSGAWVYLSEGVFGGQQYGWGNTQADGTFLIDGVVAGSYLARVYAYGYAMEVVHIDVESRKTTGIGEIRLNEGGSASGVVVDKDGKPYAAQAGIFGSASYVCAFSEDFTRWAGAALEEGGTFKMENLAIGVPYRVAVFSGKSDLDFTIAPEIILLKVVGEEKQDLKFTIQDQPPVFFAEMLRTAVGEYTVTVFCTDHLKETDPKTVVRLASGDGTLSVSSPWARRYRAVYKSAAGDTTFSLRLSGHDEAGNATDVTYQFAIGADSQSRQIFSTLVGGTVKAGGSDQSRVWLPAGSVKASGESYQASLSKVDTKSSTSGSAPSFAAPLYPFKAPPKDDNLVSSVYSFSLGDEAVIPPAHSVTLTLQYDRARATDLNKVNVWRYTPSLNVWTKVADGRRVDKSAGTVSVSVGQPGEYATFFGAPANAAENMPLDIHNYPNPFKLSGPSAATSTTFIYNVPKPGHVTIRLYNVLGEMVRTLADKDLTTAGVYTESWNGTNDVGEQVASGLYIYRIDAGISGKLVKKMAFIK